MIHLCIIYLITINGPPTKRFIIRVNGPNIMLHRCEFKLLFHILLNGFMAGDKLGSAWLYISKSGFLIPPLQKHIIFFKYHIRKNKYSRLKLVVVWHSPIFVMFVVLPDPRTIPTDNYIRLRMLDTNFSRNRGYMIMVLWIPREQETFTLFMHL